MEVRRDDNYCMRPEFLTVVTGRTSVWKVMPCGLFDRCHHFGKRCCLQVQDRKTNNLKNDNLMGLNFTVLKPNRLLCARYVPWQKQVLAEYEKTK